MLCKHRLSWNKLRMEFFSPDWLTLLDTHAHTHTHTHTQLWSHVPLSQAATLQYSGGPPSRKRYTRREFLQFSVGSDNEDENEEGLNISAPEQVRENQETGDCFENESPSLPSSFPPFLYLSLSLSHTHTHTHCRKIEEFWHFSMH